MEVGSKPVTCRVVGGTKGSLVTDGDGVDVDNAVAEGDGFNVGDAVDL